MKLVTIVGARPQFIKAAAISRALNRLNKNVGINRIKEVIVHTGQHYDDNMSRVFFEQLEIPAPDYNLGIGSGTHGHMTGAILAKVEDVLIKEQPHWVLVYGDTNSTLAGALAAVKLEIQVAHVEAGLRSFNRKMPEEVNRILTDHISNLLFVPTSTAKSNLQKEGIIEGVFHTGDVMYDAFLYYKKSALGVSKILYAVGIKPKSYSLVTVHRQENTDDKERLRNIFEALEALADESHPVVLPLHPRTRKAITHLGLKMNASSAIRMIEPVSYLDMICLQMNASVILTDSGGIQKEACYAGVPCVTLRNETEWIETISAKVNFLAGADKKKIIECFNAAKNVHVQMQQGL